VSKDSIAREFSFGLQLKKSAGNALAEAVFTWTLVFRILQSAV
jgi:hypothetical protein